MVIYLESANSTYTLVVYHRGMASVCDFNLGKTACVKSGYLRTFAIIFLIGMIAIFICVNLKPNKGIVSAEGLFFRKVAEPISIQYKAEEITTDNILYGNVEYFGFPYICVFKMIVVNEDPVAPRHYGEQHVSWPGILVDGLIFMVLFFFLLKMFKTSFW